MDLDSEQMIHQQNLVKDMRLKDAKQPQKNFNVKFPDNIEELSPSPIVNVKNKIKRKSKN